MDLPSIERALQRHSTAAAAVSALENYNSPLTDREAAALAAYQADRAEQAAAGMKLEAAAPEMLALAARPRAALHPVLAVMAVWSAARTPAVAAATQKALRTRVLSHIVAQTPLDAGEWALVLQHVTHTLAPYSRHGDGGGGAWVPPAVLSAALALCEQGAPVLLHTRAAVARVRSVAPAPRKEPRPAPGVKAGATPSDHAAALFTAVAALLRAAAQRHAASGKHTLAPEADGEEVFLDSALVRRLRRVLCRCAAPPAEAGFSLLAALEPVDAIAASLVVPRPGPEGGAEAAAAAAVAGPVPTATVTAAVKSAPGALAQLLGGVRPVAGSLRAEDPAGLAQLTLYTVGLTHTTRAMLDDYLAVLLSLDTGAVTAHLAAAGTAALAGLFLPFINNAKVMTAAVAAAVAPLYALLARRLAAHPGAAPLLPLLLETVDGVLRTRCRAPPEKAVVMQILAAMVVAVLAPALDAAPAAPPEASDPAALCPSLVDTLDAEAAVPSAELLAAVLALAAALGAAPRLAAGLAAARRAATHTGAAAAEVRRALLVHLTPAALPEPGFLDAVTAPLLGECAEVVVARPDAFLALPFALPATDGPALARLLPLLTSADALAPVAEESAAGRRRLAEVAVLLARERAEYGPLALLLTHPSGDVRAPLMGYVAEAIATDAAAARAAWAAAAVAVFGTAPGVEEAPRLLGSGDAALLALGGAVLAHAATLGPAVAGEVLLACGHDCVQTHDAHFFTPHRAALHGLPASCTRARRLCFDRLFSRGGADLLAAPAVPCALQGPLTDRREHVSTAAVRALALYLSAVSTAALGATPAARAAVLLLRDELAASEAFFAALEPRDRALASEEPAVVAAHEDAELRARQLLKSYPDRPPKGTSAEDFEATKRRDAAALAAARTALQAEMAARLRERRGEFRRHKTAFLAVQFLGTNGAFPVEAITVLYPPLLSLLRRRLGPQAEAQQSAGKGGHEDESAAAVLATLSADAVGGLLSGTALRSPGLPMTLVSARCEDARQLTPADVAQIATIALALRQSLTHMLPAAMMVVLLPFARVAFKAGRGGNAMAKTISVPTQHQIVSVLLNNVGQPQLPDPTGALQLFAGMLQSFPSLYRNVQQGFLTLMAAIPLESLPAVEAALFGANDAVREVTAAALVKFPHYSRSRRALLLAAVFVRDPSQSVARNAAAVVEDPDYAFALEPTDWADVLYFLRRYGDGGAAAAEGNALRVTALVKDLFTRADTDEAQQIAWTDDIVAVGGLAAVVALRELSPVLRDAVFPRALDFLCAVLESPETPAALLSPTLGAGRVLLRDSSEAALRAMAPGLQSRLARPPKEATPAHKELYQAAASVWLTRISCRLGELAMLESIIEQQSRILNNSTSAMVHRFVCDSMAEITKNAAARESPALEGFMNKCLKQILHSGSYVKKKAHTMGAVGVLKGLGLPALRRFHVIEMLQQAAREKTTERSGAMVFMEGLCDVLARRFEPYALSLSGILLEGVADSDSKVSECADDAAKMMMARLTGVGLRQIVPYLVTLLGSEQAKKRVAPLNLIGYVAYCAPRQLATTLPEIMRHVLACLFDVNGAVSKAAYTALGKVAGVVSNPEIQEHVDLILSAMRSPSTDTENALDALLYTRFVNVVDPASLALVAPVLIRGLGAQLPQSRPKAAQIVASMVNLVNDVNSLEPYADDLIGQLQGCTQDTRNETRTTAAKALASLTSALGGARIDAICQWCFSVLQKVQSGSVEKAGAAQVFVEVVNTCGDGLLSVYADVLARGMQDEKPPVREGFLYIMVYAPATFSMEVFQEFLPVAFPWVLESLSHYSDKVRDVALSAGDSIISLYGTRNLSLVLTPLLEGVVSEVSALRHSSLLLSSKLLLHLVAHIKKKMRIAAVSASLAAADEAAAVATAAPGTGEGEGDDNDAVEGDGQVLTVESARDVESRGISIIGTLEETLTHDNFVRLLSAIFCGRNELNVDVRTDCNLAWTAAVASIRAAVNKIFDGLVHQLIAFSASENPDCNEVAQSTIEFTCRMNETVDRFLVSLCTVFREASQEDRRTRLGALVCLTTVLPFADTARVLAHGGEIVGCVLPGMEDSDPEVQRAAREAFAKVSRSSGSRLVESAVEAQLGVSVRGVLEVVKVKPDVALGLVFQYLRSRETHEEYSVELLEAVLGVSEAQEQLGKYANDVTALLVTFLVQGLESAGPVLSSFIADSQEYDVNEGAVEAFKAALNVPARRRGGLLAAGAYACGTDTDDTEGITAALWSLIDALGDRTDETRLVAVRLLPEVLTSLEEAVTSALDDEAQADVPTCKRAAGRYLIQYLETFHNAVGVTARAFIGADTPSFTALAEGEPRTFDVLMALYYRGLDYGTPTQRVEAVECIQDLLEFAPRELSAAVANTIAGRCSKVLFVRNEGEVVLALVRLCLQLLQYPASGKEKMVESTMALALFGAALCDSAEARALTLRVTTVLLERSEKYADLILGNVVTKKAAVDSPLLRTVLCRFVSVVIRYGHFEKSLTHIVKLMDLVRPLWESPESAAVGAAGGVAVGALCRSASIADAAVSEIREHTLGLLSTKGAHAICGFAAVYSLITAAPARVDAVFVEQAARHLQAAAAFGYADKLSSVWLMRAAAAVASTKIVSAETFNVSAYAPTLRRVNASDELSLSSAQHFYDCVVTAYPACEPLIAEFPRDYSSQWNVMGHFDADFDDEMEADLF